MPLPDWLVHCCQAALISLAHTHTHRELLKTVIFPTTEGGKKPEHPEEPHADAGKLHTVGKPEIEPESLGTSLAL